MTNTALWTLEASADNARGILGAYTQNECSEWPTCVRHYLCAKQSLINALDSTTGRRVLPVTYHPDGDQIADAWRHALDSGALAGAMEDLNRAELNHVNNPTAESATALTKKQQAYARLVQAQAALIEFRSNVTCADLSAGKLSANYDGWYPPLAKIVRAGMSISRALGALLRHRGMSADEASAVVDAVQTAAAPKPTQGFLVLSANILDFLLVSESACYTTCHGLDGSYRAGVLQYLYDSCSLIAYYYETERACLLGARGHKLTHNLPFKLWRQMVYVDTDHSAAALQRHYPHCRAIPESLHTTVRREVAKLLLRLQGKPDDSCKWKLATNAEDAHIARGAQLGYLDHTEHYVSLDSERPRIQLAPRVYCPACAGKLCESSQLLCDHCLCPHRCDACNAALDEEDCYNVDDSTYCSSCFYEHYQTCVHCCDDTPIDDVVYCGPRHRPYCSDCADQFFPECNECSERYAEDALDEDGHCPECTHYQSCEGCNERTHQEDLDSNGYCPACAQCEECCEVINRSDLCDGSIPDTNGSCQSCAEQQALRLRLAMRLIRSPLYQRTPLHAQQRWLEQKSTNTNPTYLPTLLTLAQTALTNGQTY